MTSFVDSHCHINFPELYQNIDSILSKMSSNKVTHALCVSVTLDKLPDIFKIANKYPHIFASVGVHPDYEDIEEPSIEELCRLSQENKVVAIGETGLDYFRTGEDLIHLQQHSFEAHITIAKENNIALQIHDRDAHADVVATLKRVGAPERTVFHCFSGDKELAEILIENGWYASFAGTITFKKNQELRDALAMLPPELILVETDAPFLTPEPFRGRPNSPYLIPITVRKMAEVRGISEEEMAGQITKNTEAVYGLWSDGLNG